MPDRTAWRHFSYPIPPGPTATDRMCAVLTFIRDHPDQYRQNIWGRREPLPLRTRLGYRLTRRRRPPYVGVTACIAGWAYLLHTVDPVWDGDGLDSRVVFGEAQAILGLTDRQAHDLFAWGALDFPGLVRRVYQVTGIDHSDLIPKAGRVDR